MAGTFRWLSSFFKPQVVETRPSRLSQMLEVAFDNGRYVLNAPTVNYSYGTLHTIFFQLFQNYSVLERKPQRVLILGFGGGSVAQLLRPLKPETKIVGVELDDEVIALARKYFPQAFDNVDIAHCDAATYFEVLPPDITFDLIIVDVFVDARVPLHLQSPTFLSALRSHLSHNGMLAFNYVADTPELNLASRHFEELFGLYFADYEVFACLGNRVFVARDVPRATPSS